MPGTINGVGTGYWGKTELTTRRDTCERCGQDVALRSYETQLCIVVLFVPVFPLGKRKIIDECPRCTWHRSAPLDAWRRLERERIAEATRAADASPGDPKASLDLLGVLLAVHRRDDARRLVSLLEGRAGGDCELLVALADARAALGDDAAALEGYAQAAAIDPGGATAPGRRARVRGAALALVFGDFPRARALEAFLDGGRARELPAAAVAEASWALARAWQEAAQHEDALRHLGRALAAVPDLARDPGFYDVVRASERAVGRAAPMIQVAPPRPSRHRPLVALAGVALAAAAAFGVACAGYARFRTLHVINATPRAARVTVDGRTVEVPAGGRETLTLAEGTYGARVEQDGLPVVEEALTLSTTAWRRPFDAPLFVLNVRGVGLLVWEQATYDAGGQIPPERRLSVGEPFVAWDDIDHPFDEFPPQVRARKHEVVRRTRVGWVPVPGESLPGAILGVDAPPERRARWAEALLELAPDDETLPWAYVGVALQHGLGPRAAAYLERRLDDRPLRLEWHRAYQEASDDDVALRPRYDALLAREPGGPALYLRGRLAETGDEAADLFHRAAGAAPPVAHALHALGRLELGRGRYREARELLDRALDLRPDRGDFQASLWDARALLGEGQGVEREVRAALGAAPRALQLQRRLLALLGARGDLAGAVAAHRAFATGAVEDDPSGAVARRSELELAHQQRDADRLAALGAALGAADAEGGEAGLVAAALRGDLAEAEARAAPTARRAVLLACAHVALGSPGGAARWKGEAARLLAAGRQDDRRLAALLARPAGPAAADCLDAVAGDDVVVAAVAVVLASSAAPELREALLARARAHIGDGTFPSCLVADGIAALRR